MSANHVIQTQFKLNTYVMESHLEGIDEAESFRASAGGNSLNWVLGHLLYTRNAKILDLVGKESLDLADLGRYARSSEPLTDPSEGIALEDLRAMIEPTTQEILQGIAELPSAWWEEKAPFSFVQDPEETMAGLLAGFVFHESYHCGQIALIRRLLGKPGLIQ